MAFNSRDKFVGRGAQTRPANRFERVHLEVEAEQSFDAEFDGKARTLSVVPPRLKTQFLPDASQSILSHNDSPDVGFDWSINPYRGCEHG